MGSCMSSKNSRSSHTRTSSRKKKTSRTPLSSSPSFIYVPQNEDAPATRLSGDGYAETWSNILKKKKQPATSHQTDFSQIYRRSEVVDKKLFLSTGFIAEDLYSPTRSPSLLTPITPAYHIINSTFPNSLFSPGTPSESPLVDIACYNTQTTRRPNPRRRPNTTNNSTLRPHATTVESQATTYISEDRTEPEFFAFDDEAVKRVERFYASSLKTEVIGMF